MARPRQRSVAVLLLVISAAYFAGPGIVAGSAQSSPNIGSVVISLGQRASQSVDEPGAEQQLLDMLNAVRARRGLRPLRMDRALQSVARAHSRDMATGGYIGHGSVSGGSFVDRLSGVVSRGLVGENVAFAVNPPTAHRALVASPLHLENMLEPRFHRVGVGVCSAGQMGVAVTQDFAE